MSHHSMHGVAKVEGRVWPGSSDLVTYGPYVSIKFYEAGSRSESILFTSSLSELDSIIDTISVLRRELADAQMKESLGDLANAVPRFAAANSTQ